MAIRTLRSVATEQPTSDAKPERRRLQIEKNQAASALLTKRRTTAAPDVIREQHESWTIFQKALGRNRALSNRHLLPDEAGQ